MSYKNVGRCTQVDYTLCRQCNLKEIAKQCSFGGGGGVILQDDFGKKVQEVKAEARIKVWKLKKEECCTEFRKEVRQALAGGEEIADEWESTAAVGFCFITLYTAPDLNTNKYE